MIVVDGKDGVVLWNTTSHRYDVSSDLVARTSSYHRDVFLFRMQGRKGDGALNQAAIHGATGAQRVVSKWRQICLKFYINNHQWNIYVSKSRNKSKQEVKCKNTH